MQTNAAMYVGYADDDEDVDSIMKKFKALEEVAEAKRSAGAADLSEEDLVKAVGLRVGCGVDYSMDADRAGAGGASGSRHRGPKGEHVQTGEVQIVPAHVAPEELDAADAADAKRRLKAGPDYLPPAQRRDEQVTMPSLVPLELNKDVVMVELEGIYAACREAAFAAMPASVAEEERHAFLDALTRELRLMAARGTPKEERTLEKAAHKVVETIEKAYEKTTTVASSAPIVDAPDDGASTMAPDAARRCAAALARAAARDSKSGSKSALRVRSKGTGLICVRPGGIAPNTYLGAYCGELYPGWRWYEKEAAAQAVRRDVRTSLDEVPVFYNAAVERDGDDPRGYDCLFIDGAVKGSILTRASHSCAPNAAMRVRVRDGAYAVEMASVERVRVGDEICWDYRCRTDSEREMRAALCLCGSRQCRVSYLHFAGHDDTSCVLKKRGTVAHFTAALLRACGPCGDGRARTERDSVANESNALSSGSAAAAAAADAALARRAAQAGFKAGTRDAPGVLFGLPAWLTRYVAFCVAFAAEEREALAEVLEARFAAETNASDEKVTRATTESGANESKSASRLDAEAEAEGVHAGRLQSLAVTLDKVRHVLVHACGGEDKIATAPPPLAALDDAAATAHLAATRRRVADAARALGVDVPEDRVSRSASHKKNPSEYDELVEARRALASLATSLRTQVAQVDTHVVSAACSAAADLCDLAARTKTFFRAVPVRAFESPFVQVGKFDGGDAGTTRRASYGPLSAWAFLVTWHAEFEERADRALELETRGATRLPRPDGPLRRSAMRGGMNENAKASDLQTFAAFGPKKNPKIPRGPIGAQPERFALDLLDASRGAVFEPWPAVLGWEWARLRDVADASLRQSEAGACEDAKTRRDEGGETVGETRGSDGVFGSPALDDALAEAEDADGVASADAEDASGADGSYEDAAMLLARARTRKSASDVETDDTLSAPACVPAWNADRGLGVTFVASRGDQIALGPARRPPRAPEVGGSARGGAPNSLAKTLLEPPKAFSKSAPPEKKPATALPPRDDTTRLVERAMAEVANTLAGSPSAIGSETFSAKTKTSERVAAAPATDSETDAAELRENVAPTSRPRTPAYGDAFDASATCAGCGGPGADGHFLLCQGCPAGGHLDCLGLAAAPEGRWECEACEGGRLAGIRPPGRAGFEAAAAAAAAAGKVGGSAAGAAGAAGGVAGLSVVPGAVAPVPSVGPLATHHLAASVVVDFVKGGAAARAAAEAAAASAAGESLGGEGLALGAKRSAREAFLDESADALAMERPRASFSASFPMPRTCAAAVAVECGGALGEFRVTEGLVHCFCRGCQAACEVGLQPTNVFGLQAFEFHGGKGSAGKWKASVKAFPNGFPPELLRAEPGEEISTRRDAGEPLGNWLERECPEHPVLSRSRPSKD